MCLEDDWMPELDIFQDVEETKHLSKSKDRKTLDYETGEFGDIFNDEDYLPLIYLALEKDH